MLGVVRHILLIVAVFLPLLMDGSPAVTPGGLRFTAAPENTSLDLFSGKRKPFVGETAIGFDMKIFNSESFGQILALDIPDNPKSQKKVADSIKSMPKDPSSPGGYSIILFNANPPDISPKPVLMDDVRLLVDYLQEDPGIRIVNASQFSTSTATISAFPPTSAQPIPILRPERHFPCACLGFIPDKCAADPRPTALRDLSPAHISF